MTMKPFMRFPVIQLILLAGLCLGFLSVYLKVSLIVPVGTSLSILVGALSSAVIALLLLYRWEKWQNVRVVKLPMVHDPTFVINGTERRLTSNELVIWSSIMGADFQADERRGRLMNEDGFPFCGYQYNLEKPFELVIGKNIIVQISTLVSEQQVKQGDVIRIYILQPLKSKAAFVKHAS